MRLFSSRSLWLALLIASSPLGVRAAYAAEPEKPWKALFERCQKLSNEGDYPGALEACEQAYTLNPDPGILAYIAQIQTALLRPVQARNALNRYLQAAQLDAADRKTAEAQVRYLDRLIGTLSVATQIEGAEIRVDDQVVDTATLAKGVPLSAGYHQVTLKAPGTTSSRFVTLRGGERTQLELPGNGSIALSCAAPNAQFFVDGQEVDATQAARGVSRPAGTHRVAFKAGSTTWPEQTVTVNPDERIAVVCTAPPPSQVSTAHSSMNPRGYWVTGAGLSLGVAAIVTAIHNGREYRRWEDANDDLARNISRLTFEESQSQSRENDDLMASIKTRRNVSIGLGVAGAVITAGGVALLFADSKATPRNEASSWFHRVAGGLSFSGAKSSGEIAWRGAW